MSYASASAAASLTLLLLCFLSAPADGCDPRYEAVNPNHTGCINPPRRPKQGISAQDKHDILHWHNFYRGHVEDFDQPAATNMLKMIWDDELADLAQRWAGNCMFMHEPNSEDRTIPGRYRVGQNLAIMNEYSWNLTMYIWHAEVDNFRFRKGSVNGRRIGHYTQMVWAQSTHVGCGYALCNGTRNFYVCDYGPTGNIAKRVRTPYRVGKKGSACPKSYNEKTGLCECGGKHCYNGGVLDLSTCKCRCRSKAWLNKEDCSLNCGQAKDAFLCESVGGWWTTSQCGRAKNIPYDYCPVTCRWCPDRDGKYWGLKDKPKPAVTPAPTIPTTTELITTRTSRVPPTTRRAKPITKAPAPPPGLAPCEKIEEPKCGEPSANGYWPRAYCSKSWLGYYCPALCGKCSASACKDYKGVKHKIGSSWVTRFGKMTCTHSGVQVQEGCQRNGEFIEEGSSYTHQQDNIRWTCECQGLGNGQRQLKCRGVWMMKPLR